MARPEKNTPAGKSPGPEQTPGEKKGGFTAFLEKQSTIIRKNQGRKQVTYLEAMAETLWQEALSGNLTAIKYIYDRIDGRPKVKAESPAIDNFVFAFRDFKIFTGPEDEEPGTVKKKKDFQYYIKMCGDRVYKGPDKRNITYKEAIGEVLWEIAFTGNIAAIKYIEERLDGKIVT